MVTENEAIRRIKEFEELYSALGYPEKTNITEIFEVTVSVIEEIHQYRAIGTVEECRAVVEKQRAKKPIKDREQEIRYTSAYSCPTCGRGFTGTGIADYCYHCGQKLDWGEEE